MKYAAQKGIDVYLNKPLGEGTDGNVWPTNRKSAVKALLLEKNYVQERNCYQRLEHHRIDQIDGLTIPKLIDFDDELLIVEMEVVKPPYLLDFGKSYLDQSSPFSQEELSSYHVSLSSYFPSADIPRVKKICRILKTYYGIEYLDAKPKNIRLRTDAEEDAFIDEDWDREPPTDYSSEDLME